MFFDHYPYTNFHNVNLDWVLQAVKAWGRTVEANDQAFKDLEEANESFKAYVRNYLQDLDITDEINTKLDRMLAEGTLTPYFAPYVKGYVESWLANNVTPTTPALDKTLSLDDAAANAAATGERIESAAYLRTLDGPKLSNLLNKNLIIPGYRIQSACNAGGYFYVCGGSEAADGKGFIAKMSSLDFKDAKITYYTDLGHANDITYSYTTHRLYVTTVGEGVEWGIWNINPNDLTDKTLITNCPENTIGIQFVGGWVFVLAPPRIYRTLDFETYTLVINNTNEILNKFSIQSDNRISQTLVRLPNDVVGWVGSYIKEPEHIWYGFIAYFGSHGAITFDVFPTYNAECQAAIWDEKSTVYVISNGTTSPAYTVLRMDCGDLKYLELGAGKNLNNYTGEGLFYLIGAATMDNCPVNNEGLTLKVSRQGLLNTRQDIYTNSGRHLYRIKLFNAGTWGEWVEQAAEIAQIKEDLNGKASTIVVADISGNGINLFNKNNPAYTIDYISGDTTDGFKITAGKTARPNALIYLPCKPFTQYTITKGISNIFRTGYVKGNVEVGAVVYEYHIEPATSTKCTMLTGEDATYIVIWVGQNMQESAFIELAETIQIEENSNATPITTYITGHDEIARRANNKDISILFVGNSVLEDAVAYLPYLLKSLCPELNFKIYLWYRGGRTLAEQYDGFQNDVVADRVSVAENTRRWTINSNSMTMADVLASYTFDVVCMMDYYNRLNTADNASTDWNNCANYIRTNYKGGNALKFVEFIHAPSRSAIEDKFTLALAGCKKVLKETNCQGLLAGGIAIYKAFSTDLDSLGDYGHLSVDGAHAQEGLPCLIQTYTILLWILGELGINRSIYGSNTAITQTVYNSINTPGVNLGTGVITGTDAQNVLAQELAIIAYKTAQGILNQIDYLGE